MPLPMVRKPLPVVKKLLANMRGFLVLSLVFIGVILALIVMVTPLQPLLKNWLHMWSTDDVVVLVAPFADGSDGKTGSVVARNLVHELTQQANGQYVVSLLDERPNNEHESMALTTKQKGDVLLWGNILPGAMFDDPALQPRLIALPNGKNGPCAWAGYGERFAMPRSYQLSLIPVNGKAVLPRLMNVLFHYQRGTADVAFEQAEALLREHPAMEQPFLWMVRGNILWARGEYQQALDAYHQDQAMQRFSNDVDRALYMNNLAAIWLDLGAIANAQQALQAATTYLGKQEVREVYVNQGLLQLQLGNATQAITSFEHALNIPQEQGLDTPILLALAQAQRDLGVLDVAETTLQRAEQTYQTDSACTLLEWQNLLRDSLWAAINDQQGLLLLAQSVHARGPLPWELEVTLPQSDEHITQALDKLRQAVETMNNVMREWQHRVTADEAAVRFTAMTPPTANLLSTGQKRQAEVMLNRFKYHLALVLIEKGRINLGKQPGFLDSVARLFFGDDQPLNEATRLLKAIIDSPDQAMLSFDRLQARIAYARLLRIQGMNSQAEEQYNQSIAQAPQFPESSYGKGRLALSRGDRQTAQQLMQQALASNDRFFPARIALAEFARQDGNVAEFLNQWRVLASQYPTEETIVQVASAMRQSGPSFYAEAESLLTPFIEKQRVVALIERGRIRREKARLNNDQTQSKAAIQDFQQALTIERYSATAAFELAITLRDSGDVRGAERQLLNTIALDSNHMQAQFALAELYLGPLRNTEAGVKIYAAILNNGLQDPQALQAMGNSLLLHNRAELAATAFQQAIALQKTNLRYHLDLACAYLGMKDTNRAIHEIDSVLKTLDISGKDDTVLRADALVAKGDAELQRNQPERATPFYQQALKLQPELVGAALGLGQIATIQGNWSVAERYFTNALLFPQGKNNPLAHFWIAETRLRQKRLHEAIAAYEQALRLRPEFPEALLGIAQAQYALEKNSYRAALEILNQALAWQPSYAEALLFKCKVLREHNDIDQAFDACTQSINWNDQLAEAYYLRGTIFIQRMNYNRAASDLQRAANLQPNAETFYWLGRSYSELNDFRLASQAFQQAVKLQSGNYPEAQYYQAVAEDRLGHKDNAKALWRSLVQNAQSGEWATKAQVELER